ncbi:MAG TPA: RtcB family protein [Geminicoccaceae bacterium]|nr:RtcB family protein [Geminicoccaceae bacterium]
MDITQLERISDVEWRIPATGAMRVPGTIYADEELIRAMDDKVREQVSNVATLPGIVKASFALPDAHWGYGFPIGGVAAFDPDQDGVISAGGVGFDISCGVRTMLTGVTRAELEPIKDRVADALFRAVPAGLGSTGEIRLDDDEMTAMLDGGARWAVQRGYGEPGDLARIEEGGRARDARPEFVSSRARQRQRGQMGTLGSGNHYLEVQEVVDIIDPDVAAAFGLRQGEVVITIHCGSRGLGHQIGTEFLREMTIAAEAAGIRLPERELACAPIRSEVGQRYLGAMRAGINCALANRQIIGHLAREAFADVFPNAKMPLLFDVSHNTCKVEEHEVNGGRREVYVHRKGATRAFGPGHPALPEDLRPFGQPVLIGGSMGTESWVLVGTRESEARAFSSAVHGAGRSMSRHQAVRQWQGRALINQLRTQGIVIRSHSTRGVAEEAPGAYKDVGAVVVVAERAGLARRVARLKPLISIKG